MVRGKMSIDNENVKKIVEKGNNTSKWLK